METQLVKGAGQQAAGQQQQQHVPEPQLQGAGAPSAEPQQELQQQVHEEQQQRQVQQNGTQTVPEPVQRLKNCKLLHSSPGKVCASNICYPGARAPAADMNMAASSFYELDQHQG
jgi:hypothetical protein